MLHMALHSMSTLYILHEDMITVCRQHTKSHPLYRLLQKPLCNLYFQEIRRHRGTDLSCLVSKDWQTMKGAASCFSWHAIDHWKTFFVVCRAHGSRHRLADVNKKLLSYWNISCWHTRCIANSAQLVSSTHTTVTNCVMRIYKIIEHPENKYTPLIFISKHTHRAAKMKNVRLIHIEVRRCTHISVLYLSSFNFTRYPLSNNL